MMVKKGRYIIFAFCAALICSWACGEDITNYSDCDSCPGTIHYAVEEAKAILGTEGFHLASQLRQGKKIKMDLDGIMQNGSAADSDDGYELVIHGEASTVYIRDITDGSYIQIVTDPQGARHQGSNPAMWFPEIYLQSAKTNKIQLQDSVDVAWGKMKGSNIYRWMTLQAKEGGSTNAMGQKILSAFRLLAE